MPFAIDYDIFRLQVSVKDLHGMQMADSYKRLHEVKFGLGLLHSFYLSQEVEELSAVAILHTEDEAVGCLETHVELGDKRMPIALL